MFSCGAMGECNGEYDGLLKDGNGKDGLDVFIRTATGIKRVLPSIFNLKVVSCDTCQHYGMCL